MLILFYCSFPTFRNKILRMEWNWRKLLSTRPLPGVIYDSPQWLIIVNKYGRKHFTLWVQDRDQLLISFGYGSEWGPVGAAEFCNIYKYIYIYIWCIYIYTYIYIILIHYVLYLRTLQIVKKCWVRFFFCTITCFMLGKKNGERSPSCFDLATMCNQFLSGETSISIVYAMVGWYSGPVWNPSGPFSFLCAGNAHCGAHPESKAT